MQIKIGKKDILWNYAGTLFNMGSSYIQMPFLLIFLESDILGLWYVLMSLSAISNLITFGFTPSFSRSVAYCWSGASVLSEEGIVSINNTGARNYHLMVKIITTCRLIYLIMACIATLLLATIGSLYFFSLSTEIISFNIGIGWIIFLIAVFINLYYGYYSSILIGVGGVEENNKVIIISNIIRVILLIIFLVAKTSIAGACFVYLVYGFISRILCKFYFEKISRFSKMKKEMNISITYLDIVDTFIKLWHNAWRDGLVSVSDYISSQAGTIICSTFLTLEQTGVYSITSQIAVAVAKTSRSIYTAHYPVLQSAFVNKDKDKAKETQRMCVSGFIMIFVIGTIVVLVVGIPFLKLFGKNINICLYIGLAMCQFLVSYRNCYTSYLSCTNRLWYWKSFIITSIFCLFVEVLLFKIMHLNVWAIVIASFCSEIAYNSWHWMFLVNKELGINFSDYVLGIKEFLRLFKKNSP